MRLAEYDDDVSMMPSGHAGGGWMDKMLGKGTVTGEVERRFVKFRMLRKKALRITIEKLTRQLQGSKAEL